MSIARQPQVQGTSWLTRRTGLIPTSPPATRRSKQTVLDEATRPSAAEPASDVVFSRHGLGAGAHLIDVHDYFRRELREVREVLDQVKQGAASVSEARGQLNQKALRANDWAVGGVCQAQCRSVTRHHGMEDAAVFPHLRSRQRDLTAVLDRLDQEHHAIHDLLESVDAALVHLADHPGDYGPLTEAVDLLTDTLLSHFAYEEHELIAPLARYGFFPGQIQQGLVSGG
jgi:hemerythrin-like domain-containing protein